MSKNALFAGLPDDLPDDPDDGTRQTVLPDELKGKTPEEMYQILREENQKMLQSQQDRMSEPLQQQQQQQQEPPKQQQQQTAPTAPPPPQYQPQYQQYPQEQDQPVDIFTDPDKFMDQQFQRRMGPVVQSTFTALRETNKNSFKNEVGNEEWSKYGEEIEQFVAGLNPNVQIDPRAYRTAYNYVRSLHVDDIAQSKADQIVEQKVRERLEALGYDPSLAQGTEGNVDQRVTQAVQQGNQQPQQQSSLFQRDLGIAPASAGRQTSTPATQSKARAKLTEDEKRAAKAFGMTEEEYLDYAKFNTDIFSQMGE